MLSQGTSQYGYWPRAACAAWPKLYRQKLGLEYFKRLAKALKAPIASLLDD